MLKVPPQDFGARPFVSSATNKPTELRDPVDCLAKRGWRTRWLGDALDGTIKCLPFLRPQQRATGSLGDHASQHGGVKKTPRKHTVKRQTAMPAIRCGELARFQTATTFQNPVPALDFPTTRVPRDAFDRLISMGATFNEALTSRTCTAHSDTAGKPSCWR
jgi:hypothetical protein